MICWALNIKPAKDEKGKPILPDRNNFIDAGVVV
jgi:hypothetical protein